VAEISRSRRYFAGLATGYTVTMLTMVIGLWLTPFTLKFLTREEFAIFTLASDVILWLSLVDLGIASSLKVQAAQMTGKDDPFRASRIASTAFFAELGVGLLIFLFGAVIALFFPSLFDVSESIRSDAVNVVLIFSLSTAVNIGLQTYSALLIAHQQIHIDNFLRIFLLLMRTLLTVLLLLAGWKMYSIAVANLISVLVSSTIAGVRCRYTIRDVSLRMSFFSFGELKSLGSMGIWFTVGGLAGILIEGMDRVVAAKIISLESVTTLALTGRLYSIAYGVIGQITNTARPVLGQMLGKRDMTSTRRVYDRMALFSTGIAVCVGLAIMAGNGAFVKWWVGEKNYGGIWLDIAFAVNLIVNSWILPNRATLAAGLIIKQNSLSRIAEGIINFAASVVLGYLFGLAGVIAGTAIACVVSSFWYMPMLTARMFEEKPGMFFWSQVRLIGPFFVFSLLSALAVRLFVSGYKGPFLAAGAMSGALVVSALIFWLLCLDPEEKANLRSTLFSFTGGFRRGG